MTVFSGWISPTLQIFLEEIFFLMVFSFCFRTQGDIFPLVFFPTTAQRVGSDALFSQFWLLRSTAVITEFHVASSPCRATAFLTGKRTPRGAELFSTSLTWKRTPTPDSHFSFLRSAVLPSQSSQPWPTIKLPLISPRELYFFFRSMPRSWWQVNHIFLWPFLQKPNVFGRNIKLTVLTRNHTARTPGVERHDMS